MTSISISTSERIAFVGATGSGKTVLAKTFLAGLNRCIIIDPKHTFHLDGYKIRQGYRQGFGREFRQIIRPWRAEDSNLAAFLLRLFDLGDVYIYIDELGTMADAYPQSIEVLADIARTGREKHVAIWAAMQRPRNVPRVFLTETETFFVFSLRSQEDRDAIKGFTGNEVMEKLPRFYFWYFRADEENPALMSYNRETEYIEEFTRKEVVING